MSKGLFGYLFAGIVTMVIWVVGIIVIIKTGYYYAKNRSDFAVTATKIIKLENAQESSDTV